MAGDYETYRRLPGIVLGFHGCDKKVGERILRGKSSHLASSDNSYDWLGSGIYFWENDPKRALEFAKEAKKKRHLTKGLIKTPFVVGAVIDLGLCMNLLDRRILAEVARAHRILKALHLARGTPMPQNRGQDLDARFLDKLVLELVHASRKRLNTGNKRGKYEPYDTVRGAFWEGGALYPTSGFSKKSHIQIAVRNLKSIKGYFRPFD